MRRFLLIHTFFLSLATAISCNGQIQGPPLPEARSEPSMKAELETVYENWRQAILRKDLRGWESSVSTFRKMETRNQIVSQKHPFPAALFDNQPIPPLLGNLIHLDVLTRRETASSIYFGKHNFGEDDPNRVRNTFIVLRYLKENGSWRFDNIRIVNIGKDIDILHSIRLGDMSFLKGEEFQPLEEVPMIPQAVSQPDLLGEIWVTAIGFEAEIWINGHRIGKIKNGQGKEIVVGGVRRGQNQITIRSKRLPAGETPHRFEAAVYAAPDHGKKADRVFHFPAQSTLKDEVTIGFSGS